MDERTNPYWHGNGVARTDIVLAYGHPGWKQAILLAYDQRGWGASDVGTKRTKRQTDKTTGRTSWKHNVPAACYAALYLRERKNNRDILILSAVVCYSALGSSRKTIHWKWFSSTFRCINIRLCFSYNNQSTVLGGWLWSVQFVECRLLTCRRWLLPSWGLTPYNTWRQRPPRRHTDHLQDPTHRDAPVEFIIHTRARAALVTRLVLQKNYTK